MACRSRVCCQSCLMIPGDQYWDIGLNLVFKICVYIQGLNWDHVVFRSPVLSLSQPSTSELSYIPPSFLLPTDVFHAAEGWNGFSLTNDLTSRTTHTQMICIWASVCWRRVSARRIPHCWMMGWLLFCFLETVLEVWATVAFFFVFTHLKHRLYLILESSSLCWCHWFGTIQPKKADFCDTFELIGRYCAVCK